MAAINFDQPSGGKFSSLVNPAVPEDGGTAFGVENTASGPNGGEAIRGTTNSDVHGGVVGVSNGAAYAVYAINTKDGGAIGAEATGHGVGVYAYSHKDKDAVVGMNDGSPQTIGDPNLPFGRGVYGMSINGEGVHGETNSDLHGGVVGVSNGAAYSVYALNTNASKNGGAIGGESKGNGAAVYGLNHQGYAAVVGKNDGPGHGVLGQSTNAAGVRGESTNFEGVHGETMSNEHGAIVGISNATQPNEYAAAIYGKGINAGYFEGNVQVAGNITVTGDIILSNPGSDCAEEFDLSTTDVIDPGTVMVLDQTGNLEQSHQSYDKKVTGIVSGAGDYKPAILLDKKSSKSDGKRIPIALMGKVYCKVDATNSPIDIGDLLTTSSTKGHAMKAEDPFKAFGSVIGKALGSIKEGLGMIPVLVALQ